MFWRFGGYASISSIDTILDKSDVTLEELLDESDLIQELKQHNSKLIEYLRDENVLRRLLEYVITPQAPKPDDDGEELSEEEDTHRGHSLSPFRRNKDKEKSRRREEREAWDRADKARLKYAYVACEILSSETWSILEALMENQQHLLEFWKFLRREPPLDTTEAGYFTKVNDTLLDKKTEETLTFIKSLEGIIPAMLMHVDCPMVMDLLLKIISMEKSEGGVGIVDVWRSPLRLAQAHPFEMLTWKIVASKPGSHTPSAGLFIRAISTCHSNISWRLYQGHHYHISQCIPERAIMHRSEQSHKTACFGTLYTDFDQ
jgi:SIT4-associating protein SAP185/190